MNKVKTGLLAALVLIISFSGYSNNAETKNPADAFFDQLSQLCGKSFSGKTIYPNIPSDPFVGVKLVINFSECSENEIRVPFRVGEDTSRTWIITKTAKGLLLKHDHRHKDGTADKITMYGGYADQLGNPFRQNFHADQHTAALIPAAKTNVWSLSLDQSKNTLTYYLERNAKKRFKAVFELK